MVCMVFHFGFSVWGILPWTSLSTACSHLLETQYKTLFAFHHICVVANVIFLGLFFLHEVYLGHMWGVDLTLMSEIYRQQESPFNQLPAPPHIDSADPSKFPQPHTPASQHLVNDDGHTHKQGMNPFAGGAGAQHDLAKEYENAMAQQPAIPPIQLPSH